MSDKSTNPWFFDLNENTAGLDGYSYDQNSVATKPKVLYVSIRVLRLTRTSYYGMQDLLLGEDENLLSRFSNAVSHQDYSLHQNYPHHANYNYTQVAAAAAVKMGTCTDSPGILFPGIDFWGWYLGLLDVLKMLHGSYVDGTEIRHSYDNDLTLKHIVVSIVQSCMKGNYSDHQIECIAQRSFTGGATSVNELLAFLGLVVFKYDPFGGRRLALLKTLEVSPHRKYSAVSEVLKVTIPVLKGYNTKTDMTSSSYDRFGKVFFSQLTKNKSWLGRAAEKFSSVCGEDYFRFIHHLRVDYPFVDETFSKTEVENNLEFLNNLGGTGGTGDHEDDPNDYTSL